MPSRLANGILQFRPNNWSTNTTGLYPTDWRISSSGQTTGLRIPVYTQPIGQRNSPVHAKQLVYELSVYTQPIGHRNSTVQTKQLVYEYQFISNRLVNGILQVRPNNWSTNTSLYPTDWATEFFRSGQTTGLRIPVHIQPIGQRNSSGQATQLVYEYQFISNRLVNGILQVRPNNWSTTTSLCPIDWSTEFFRSGQTTGLRLPVYVQSICQRNSPVQAKRLILFCLVHIYCS